MKDELSSASASRTARCKNKNLSVEEGRQLREELSILNRQRMLRYWEMKKESE